jgi:hypothetical protein
VKPLSYQAGAAIYAATKGLRFDARFLPNVFEWGEVMADMLLNAPIPANCVAMDNGLVVNVHTGQVVGRVKPDVTVVRNELVLPG